jgi:flagellar motor protein MotB
LTPRWRVAALAACAACVPKGQHELVQMQLDATRTALSARTGECYERDELHAAEVRTLQEEKGQLALRIEELGEQLETLQAALEATRSAPGASEEPLAAGLAALQEAEADARRRAEDLAEIEAALQPLVDAGRVVVRVADQHVRVELPWDKLFQPGIVGLTLWGQAITGDLALALAHLPARRVRVEGHANDPSFHSAEYPSAWELAVGRAMLVLRALKEGGMTMPSFAAGFVEPMPGDPGPARRIDVVIGLRALDG